MFLNEFWSWYLGLYFRDLIYVLRQEFFLLVLLLLLEFIICKLSNKLGLIVPVLSAIYLAYHEWPYIHMVLHSGEALTASVLTAAFHLITIGIFPLFTFLVYLAFRRKHRYSELKKMKIDDL